MYLMGGVSGLQAFFVLDTSESSSSSLHGGSRHIMENHARTVVF